MIQLTSDVELIIKSFYPDNMLDRLNMFLCSEPKFTIFNLRNTYFSVLNLNFSTPI